jgi:hypothetical protein
MGNTVPQNESVAMVETSTFNNNTGKDKLYSVLQEKWIKCKYQQN